MIFFEHPKHVKTYGYRNIDIFIYLFSLPRRLVTIRVVLVIFGPRRDKTGFRVSDKARFKPVSAVETS